MKGGKQPHGFTIVETMIVLAVTGLLLISAMQLISGKQAESQFQVGINNLQQQLQQIINETASGYYPNNSDFSCTGSTNGFNPDIVSVANGGGSSQQGTNDDCMFLGKALRFGWATPGGNGKYSGDMTVYPLAGNRLNQSQQPVTSLTEAWPTAIAPGCGCQGVANDGQAPDDSTLYSYESGLTFYGEKDSVNGSGHTTYGNARPTIIAFISDLGTFNNQLPTSGTVQLHMYLVNENGPWTQANTSSNYVDLIDNATQNGQPTHFDDLASIELCFSSGTTSQSGLITIGSSGSSGSGLGVSTQIYNGTTCNNL
ncbi:MAG TPA: prepilin-type N-terminal cleavage/methylation domain-containing protein [Candidatus Saccharimonadales bacterium]|nr:prepilin-type N-terminal cleavage/methylation domain-containing protein [Candidatus Saccharimonadales bacterium]